MGIFSVVLFVVLLISLLFIVNMFSSDFLMVFMFLRWFELGCL